MGKFIRAAELATKVYNEITDSAPNIPDCLVFKKLEKACKYAGNQTGLSEKEGKLLCLLLTNSWGETLDILLRPEVSEKRMKELERFKLNMGLEEVKELTELLNDAENDKGRYKKEEIHKRLFDLGLSNKDGALYNDLAGRQGLIVHCMLTC